MQIELLANVHSSCGLIHQHWWKSQTEFKHQPVQPSSAPNLPGYPLDGTIGVPQKESFNPTDTFIYIFE